MPQASGLSAFLTPPAVQRQREIDFLQSDASFVSDDDYSLSRELGTGPAVCGGTVFV